MGFRLLLRMIFYTKACLFHNLITYFHDSIHINNLTVSYFHTLERENSIIYILCTNTCSFGVVEIRYGIRKKK
jgi:hypothetical protein